MNSIKERSGGMGTIERREAILSHIQAKPGDTVAEIAQATGIEAVFVRSDLMLLRKQKKALDKRHPIAPDNAHAWFPRTSV